MLSDGPGKPITEIGAQARDTGPNSGGPAGFADRTGVSHSGSRRATRVRRSHWGSQRCVRDVAISSALLHNLRLTRPSKCASDSIQTKKPLFPQQRQRPARISMSPSSANSIFPFSASVRKRTEAPRCLVSPPPSPFKKYKSLAEIMLTAPLAVAEKESDHDDDEDVRCEQCMSGDGAEAMLLCDKCDKGFHMYCLRPIIARVPVGQWLCPNCSRKKRFRMFPLLQTKIVDFFHIQRGFNALDKCASSDDARKRRRRSAPLVMSKKKRRLLPFSPTEDPARRLEQMGSLATALTALRMEFSNELTYMPGMAARNANQAKLERGGMQVLSKEDTETLELCSAMCRRGEWPPLVVVFDTCEGFTVEADKNIKDLTLITEYAGDVDYIKNRELDDCDSMMTLLLSHNPSESLVVCPDKRGNISRFINGINNHTPEGRKKQNLKCVRYNVNGECRALLVAIRDIAKGERLYYDYNGYEQEYPTQHFV